MLQVCSVFRASEYSDVFVLVMDDIRTFKAENFKAIFQL